jgi:hypothetical protein
MHDNNQDGVINAYDDVFTHLQVWVDRNHDGVSQASELHALKDVGVQSIALNAQASTTMDNGNALSLVSHWTSQDGTRHALVDVNFTTKETAWTAAAAHAVL